MTSKTWPNTGRVLLLCLLCSLVVVVRSVAWCWVLLCVLLLCDSTSQGLSVGSIQVQLHNVRAAVLCSNSNKVNVVIQIQAELVQFQYFK
jgi:hypothetical protein